MINFQNDKHLLPVSEARTVPARFDYLIRTYAVTRVSLSRRKDLLAKKTRDGLEETEKMIRELVSDVMTMSHGRGWEKEASVGFREEEINELEQRRKDERDKLSSQTTSSKLLDYTHIVDLKNVIQKNWSEFASIFPSKDRTIDYLDTLNRFRNPTAHVRSVMLEHQYYLVLGISGELRMYIKRWRAGYKHQVKSYYCEFRFLAYDSEDAETKANEWLKKITNLSSKDIAVVSSKDFGEEKLIRLSKGHAKISNPQTIPQSGIVPYWTSVIQARVSTKSALNDILVNGKHPCWALYWTLREDINVHNLVSEINETTGLTPSSSSGIGTERTVNAEYTIRIGDKRIRIFMSGNDYGRMSPAVGLVPESSNDVGFYYAHEIFSPDSIISFLRGEINKQEFQSMLHQAKGIDNDNIL